MAATSQKLSVYVEGADEDDPIEVTADGRDFAGFELEYKTGYFKGMETMTITVFRFIAWHALRRTGRLDVKIGYADWSKDVIAVEPETPPTQADPTNQDQSGETS